MVTNITFGVEIARDLTVTNVAVEVNDKGYFKIDPPIQVCAYSVIYYSLSTESGKGHYSALLAAKKAKKAKNKLSLIAYDIDQSTNICDC